LTIGLSYSAIIAQIIANTDLFQYVAFSITPQQIQWLSSNPQYPAAFVSPGGKDTGENEISSAGDIRQEVTEHFTVCVMFANAGDLLAQDAADSVTTYREALRKSLVNWHPLPLSRTPHPVIENDDHLYVFEGGARAGWLFQYSVQYQIGTSDCYTPTPSPLVEVNVIVINQVTGEAG
jgi:hypothetical protein